MICYHCHENIPEDSKFCNLCGVKQEFSCQSCGHLLSVGSIFCNQCGTKIVESVSVEEQLKVQGKTLHLEERKSKTESGAEEKQSEETEKIASNHAAFDLKSHLHQRMEETRASFHTPHKHKEEEEPSQTQQHQEKISPPEEEDDAVGRYRETPVEKFIFVNSTLIGLRDKAVKHLVIPSFVTQIGHHAFKDCTAIKDVLLPDSVEIIGKEAFIGCSNMEVIMLSEALRIIGNGAFMGCESLREIRVPESVVTIGDMAFYSCKSLIRVDVENKKARLGSYVFNGCPWLETLQ